MKVLFEHSLPFSFAHGGVQVQIEQTKAALEKSGVEVEYLRWWDDAQKGDIIHFFGHPQVFVAEYARKTGAKIVLSELLTAQGSRPAYAHLLHGAALRLAKMVLPASLAGNLSSRICQLADACIALTPWEAHLMRRIYGVSIEKIHVVPNAVEEIFLNAKLLARGPWLVCIATITERKRVLELARAAVAARTPVWIIGRPYDRDDTYFRAFQEIAAAQPEIVRYEGCFDDRAQLAAIYREARGFVLLSSMESMSLSALEASACGCPLLLSDLPWARTTFGDAARYCPITKSTTVTAGHLRAFHDAAPQLPPPPKPKTWLEVAELLKDLYRQVLR